MKLDNKGFTLIELIAAIVLLVLLFSIGTYSVASIIKKSKKENYNLLIANIKSSAETYYQECKYSKTDAITCEENGDGNGYIVSLGKLVEYGFLIGNSKDKDNKYELVNTMNDKSIVNCKISVKYGSNEFIVQPYSNTDSNCPTSYVLDKEGNVVLDVEVQDIDTDTPLSSNNYGYVPPITKPWLKKK